MASSPPPKIEVPDYGELEVEEVKPLPQKQREEFDLVASQREDNRGRLAFAFVIGFFVILLVGIIIASLGDGDKAENISKTMLAISGVLAGPLGFVIGYYFRSSEEQ